MAGPYSPDFSILGDLGKTYKAAQLQANRERSLAALGQGASVEQVSKALMRAGDIEGGRSLAQLADAQAMRQYNIERDKRDFAWQQQQAKQQQDNSNRDFALKQRVFERGDEPEKVRILRASGINPESPEGRQALFKLDEKLGAADKKAIFEAEDDNAKLVSTVSALQRAKELNPKAFSGYGAGLLGSVGTKLPGAGLVIDPERAKATSEWEKLMSQEAIKSMADTLKGATTDFELRKFTEQLGDPTTDPGVRGRIIDRMIQLSERKNQINQTRMDQLRGGSYYKPGGGGSQTTQGANVLDEARDAINRGADKNAVIKRLREKGIDPAGL